MARKNLGIQETEVCSALLSLIGSATADTTFLSMPTPYLTRSSLRAHPALQVLPFPSLV